MKTNQSIRLFQNKFLESLTHIHPALPSIVYIPVAFYFLYLGYKTGSLMELTSFFLLGLLIWTLLEYILHRFIFHFEPRSTWGKKLHFLFHGIHHDYPNDSTRLVMPLPVSIPLAVIFYYLFLWIFKGSMYGSFAGLITGYLAYDNIHFAVHHFSMTSRWARFLKAYHLRHHFVDPNKSYGVSNPLWDYIFGTNPK